MSGKSYAEFRTVEFKKDSVVHCYRLALDEVAVFNVNAAKTEIESLQELDLLEALMDQGAVLHDHAEGSRKPAVFQIDTAFVNPRVLKRGHYAQGMPDNPAPGKPAITLYDRDSGQLRLRSFWENGVLNDPAPGVPAVMTFASVFQTLWDHMVSINARSMPSKPDDDPFAEKFRAYYKEGKLHNPSPEEAAEQCSNPHNGEIYCALRAGDNGKMSYLGREELKTLHQYMLPKRQQERNSGLAFLPEVIRPKAAVKGDALKVPPSPPPTYNI